MPDETSSAAPLAPDPGRQPFMKAKDLFPEHIEFSVVCNLALIVLMGHYAPWLSMARSHVAQPNPGTLYYGWTGFCLLEGVDCLRVT